MTANGKIDNDNAFGFFRLFYKADFCFHFAGANPRSVHEKQGFAGSQEWGHYQKRAGRMSYNMGWKYDCIMYQYLTFSKRNKKASLYKFWTYEMSSCFYELNL